MKNKIKVEDLIETMKFENWSKEELVMELNSRCRVINIKANELIKKAKQQTITEIKKKIDEIENFYPKDIYVWDNKEKLDFNRGRFHRHCFEIVENMRQKLLSLEQEKQEEK